MVKSPRQEQNWNTARSQTGHFDNKPNMSTIECYFHRETAVHIILEEDAFYVRTRPIPSRPAQITEKEFGAVRWRITCCGRPGLHMSVNELLHQGRPPLDPPPGLSLRTQLVSPATCIRVRNGAAGGPDGQWDSGLTCRPCSGTAG